MRKEKRPVSKKKRYLIVGAAVLAVAVFAVFGDKGLYDVYKLRQERDGILSYNRTIEVENTALEGQIALLKTDRRYLARIARKELGMLGKNEVVYKFEDEKK